jgi:hypothetical protein
VGRDHERIGAGAQPGRHAPSEGGAAKETARVSAKHGLARVYRGPRRRFLLRREAGTWHHGICNVYHCETGLCLPHSQCCTSDSDCTEDAANRCITNIRCVSGACEGDTLTCDDRDACTSDSCNPAVGCVNDPINCDDGNACTVDYCDATIGCLHTPKVCPDCGPCQTAHCDPVTGCGCRSFCTADQVCSDGVCCPTGQVNCGSGTCFDLTSDSHNCGVCGTACTGGTICSNSQCVCPTGQTLCGGTCYNLQTNPQHCGACAKACTAPAHATATCSGGVCDFTCNSGYTRLGGACCASTQVCGSICCPPRTVGKHCDSKKPMCVDV